MRTQEITYQNLLSKKLGDEIARYLVEFIRKNIFTEINKQMGSFLTQSDKIELINRIAESKEKQAERVDTINGQISQVKNELLVQMSNNKIDVIDRINKAKNDTLFWIVGIGLLQFLLSILAKRFLF